MKEKAEIEKVPVSEILNKMPIEERNCNDDALEVPFILGCIMFGREMIKHSFSHMI